VIISIAKKTGYCIAVLVVLAALLVVSSRIITPYLDARRPDIEIWASALLKAPVKIEKARVSWFQYQPGVALFNVTLLDIQAKEPLLQVNKIKVFFSIPQSLWQRKLVPSGIVVDGAGVVVHQEASGEFAVQGFPALGGFEQQPFKEESKIKDVVGWLSLQPRIILNDINVRYTGSNGQKYNATLMNLRLNNSSDSHSIYGQAMLNQDIATEVTVSAQWFGKTFDLQTLQGKFFINVSGMSLSQWFQHFVYKGWMIYDGLASAKIWGSWHDGGLQQIQTVFQFLDLELKSEDLKTTKNINRLSGDVGWRKDADSQVIAGDDILIDGESRLWPVTSFYLKLTPDSAGDLRPAIINIGYVDLADTRALILLAPTFIPSKLLKIINDTKLTGSLEGLSASFGNSVDPFTPTMMQGHFNQVGFTISHTLPSLQNISGHFNWKETGGSLTLQGRDSILVYDSVFDKPINFSQLMGVINWQHDDIGEWKIAFKSLQGLNRDIALTLNGDMSLPVSLKPVVNLNANFAIQNVVHIKNYLPTKVFSKELSEWLQAAFLAGNIESGSIVLRGALADFPFDHQEGEFLVKAAINNVQLHYAPAWPDLNKIKASLTFAGKGIIIDIEHAVMLDMDIGKVHGEISGIGDESLPTILTVQTTPIEADFTQGMNFLHQSPLEKTLGKMFRNVELTGPMAVTIFLKVPLENPDKTEVAGVIGMTKANLALIPWKLNITQLTGNIEFTEKTTKAAGVTGVLFNKPMQLNIESIGKSQAIVQATVTNVIDLQDIEAWLKVSLAPKVSGAANVVTKIDLALDKPIAVHVQSNLQGIKLDLPAQYGKKAEDIRMFTSDLVMSEGQPLKIKFDYADIINAALVLDHKGDHFDLLAADLRLGEGEAAWPKGNGLYITGNLKKLTDVEIKSYIDMVGKNSGVSLPLRTIDILIDELNLYGIKLSKVKVQLTPLKTTWAIDINSPEISGTVSVPLNVATHDSGIIAVDLKRINLDTLSKGKGGGVSFNPKTLPPIKFSAENLTYGGASLGKVSFNTSSKSNGLMINEFNVSSPYMNLQASGDWIQSGKNGTTRLHGKATSTSVSGLLNDLDFDAHNFIASNGNIDFDLSWSSVPYALSLSSMSGQASMSIGKGRIVEVSASTNAKMDLGRMLNLFSLQSIPRRLSLDFSDVFHKGYSFDTFRADFRFGRGDASTNNMRFDGPIARVDIRGRIGIDKKDFDLVLSVTPYVTSSIPLAATLITGQPVVGIAVWAVSSMIGGQVSKVVTYNYSVTGPWNNPAWGTLHR
jgi:uncharacterized protein (TIGR02099 family)